MRNDIQLREVQASDLDVFFQQQADPLANQMAAFTRKDPRDRSAFDQHMERVLQDASIAVRTILLDGSIVGSILEYVDDGAPQVSYWIGREHWGKGIATSALALFLPLLTERPVFARVAFDNVGSLRVLEKNGFAILERTQFHANARGAEIEEIVLKLV